MCCVVMLGRWVIDLVIELLGSLLIFLVEMFLMIWFDWCFLVIELVIVVWKLVMMMFLFLEFLVSVWLGVLDDWLVLLVVFLMGCLVLVLGVCVVFGLGMFGVLVVGVVVCVNVGVVNIRLRLSVVMLVVDDRM